MAASLPPLVDSVKEFGKTWLVVTGASRGFGASLCEEFAKVLEPGSVIVGLARSENGLANTRKNIQHENNNILFKEAQVDLGTCNDEALERILRESMGSEDDPGFQSAILVHNAGSVGTLNYLRNTHDLKMINEYFQLNVSSVIHLTSIFLKISRQFSSIPKMWVVNISSLCATVPFKSMGLYCSAKAARNMMLKVLALEEGGPSVRVLNYAPGPLDNEMQSEVRRLTEDSELRETFTKMKEDGQLVEVKTSVAKLILILRENKFENGDHIDYYEWNI